MTIQEFHSFAGHPGKFWPAFLAFACRQADAHQCVLLNKTSSCWKALYQWPTDQPLTTPSERQFALITDLAEKCLNNGRGTAHINISFRTVALGLLLDEEEGVKTRVAVFFINITPPANVDEITRRVRLIADTPAIYQCKRAAQRTQKDLVCFSDILDVLLLLNAEDRFLAAAMTLVPINSTLNRVMIKELGISAALVALFAVIMSMFKV